MGPIPSLKPSACATRALSLILCTRNRADALARCLRRLPTSALSAADGELILVDNGSSDETPALLRRFADAAACPVSVVTEPREGLSRARNAGVREAAGRTLVFTDDDCYLGDGYVRTARTVFGEANFSYCGGRILLHDPADARYGLREQTAFERIPPFSFIPPGQFQGANLVVHRRVFANIGLFDPRLGVGTPFRCGDLDLVARASQAGFAGAHVPELVVYHHHGRAGEDIRALDAANDYACGAYYAKFLRGGELSYLRGWLAEGLLSRKDLRVTLPKMVREVKGALHFVRTTEAARRGTE
jgi:glycosyltransferase involved in cell wall biosynthesis